MHMRWNPETRFYVLTCIHMYGCTCVESGSYGVADKRDAYPQFPPPHLVYASSFFSAHSSSYCSAPPSSSNFSSSSPSPSPISLDCSESSSPVLYHTLWFRFSSSPALACLVLGSWSLPSSYLLCHTSQLCFMSYMVFTFFLQG